MTTPKWRTRPKALPWVVGAILSFVAAFAPATSAKQRADTRVALPISAPSSNLVGHGGPIKAITARDTSSSSAIAVLTGSFDYSMIYWLLDEKTAHPQAAWRYPDHDGAVSAVALFEDGMTAASASDDGTVHIWSLETGTRRLKLTGHTAKILALDVSSDQRMIASASWDRTVRLWDVSAGKLVATLKGHKGPVNSVRFSHDGQHVVSASHDGTLGLWSVEKRELVRPAFKHGWGINVLERLPQAGHFAFGALDGTVGILDVHSGKLVRKLSQRDKPILSLAHLAKPGLLAIGGGDGIIDVYRTGDWVQLERHENPYGPVWAMAFVDGGSRLYFGSLDDHATVWQVKPRKPFEAVAPANFPRRFQVDANLSLGERQFARKCSICHTLTPDGRNRAGPTLYGVFGRRIAALPDYPYSKPLKNLNIVWNEETIAKLFELGPDKFTPGSKMPLQKIVDRKERRALIAFLKQATAPQ